MAYMDKCDIGGGNHLDYVYKMPREQDRVLAMKHEMIALRTALERERQLESLETSIDFLLNGTDSEYVEFNHMPNVNVQKQEVNVASRSSSATSVDSSKPSTSTGSYTTIDENQEETEGFDETLRTEYTTVELLERVQTEETVAGGFTVVEDSFFVKYCRKYVVKRN